jgi:hypothetical protein
MNDHKCNVICYKQNPSFRAKTRITIGKCASIVKRVTRLFVAIQEKKEHRAQEIILWMCLSNEIVNSK